MFEGPNVYAPDDVPEIVVCPLALQEVDELRKVLAYLAAADYARHRLSGPNSRMVEAYVVDAISDIKDTIAELLNAEAEQ